MTEKANTDQLTELMALSDEISNVNHKVKQLIEGLHSTSDQIGNLKQLTDRLTQKAAGLSSGVSGYTPEVVEDPEIGTTVPSFKAEGMKVERIEMTPQNYMKYQNIASVKSKKIEPEKPIPTMAELQQRQLDSLKARSPEAEEYASIGYEADGLSPRLTADEMQPESVAVVREPVVEEPVVEEPVVVKEDVPPPHSEQRKKRAEKVQRRKKPAAKKRAKSNTKRKTKTKKTAARKPFDNIK